MELELTRDEIVAALEEGARSRMRVSAGELLRRYREGELEDPGLVADLLVLADLLPDDDAIFRAA
ncbi:MAG: hypothetical protein HY775_09685 [Acidobacteria bacterium]|nr:hypothetical protein [Acidobacteriota bacterium]